MADTLLTCPECNGTGYEREPFACVACRGTGTIPAALLQVRRRHAAEERALERVWAQAGAEIGIADLEEEGDEDDDEE